MQRILQSSALVLLTLAACETASVPPDWSATATPCGPVGPADLAVDAEGEIWLGCGDVPGVFTQTDEGFVPVDGLQAVRAHVITFRDDGSVLVGGASADGAIVVVATDDDPEPMVLLDHTIAPEIDAITHLAVSDDGDVWAADDAQLAWYDGLFWRVTPRWGGAGIVDIASDDGSIVVAGYDDNARLALYRRLRDDPANPALTPVYPGEPMAVTSLSRAGSGVIAVGLEVGSTGARALRCERRCDDPNQWHDVDLPDELGSATAVAFDPAGRHGAMVGELTHGTWVAVTDDGGETWAPMAPIPETARTLAVTPHGDVWVGMQEPVIRSVTRGH